MPIKYLLIISSRFLPCGAKLISKTTTVKQVGYRIAHARFTKSPQTQRARIAVPTGQLVCLVTRPGEMQRSAECEACAHDLRFLQVNYRRPDRDVCFRFCAEVDHVLKRRVKLGAAIGIARRILGDCSYIYGARSDHFAPTHGGCE